MNLVYPLSLPTTPGPRSVTFGANNLVSAAISPFTGSSQITTWPGEWWEADIGLPAMTQSKAQPWVSFLTALRGQSGTFLLGDPLRISPLGVATGTPLVVGAQPGGSQQLSTDGWTASTSGILKAGDYIQIGAANLLLYSQDFRQSPWINNANSITIGTGIADPLGGSPPSTTAQSFTGGSGNNFMYQAVTAGPGTYTLSVYLKVPTGTGNLPIHLQDSVTGANVATTTCALTSSWQRFSVTGTFTSANAGIHATIVGGHAEFGTGNVVDVWGAQLEPGTNVNPYQITTTVAIPLTQRIHMLTLDANSDGSGNSTLNIFPALRPEGALDEQVIVTSNPMGLFRLAQNWRQWQYDFSKMYSLSFKAVEAL